MSFRQFIYLCCLCGGWAALAGWALSRLVPTHDAVGSAGLKALCVGTLVALALGLVDGLWNFSVHRWGQIVPRVACSVLVGAVGAVVGGVAGQVLYETWRGLFVVAWALTGLLIGASLGAFDFLWGYVHRENVRGASRKVVRGLLGGTAGGLLGGLISLELRDLWAGVFPGRPLEQLWSPSATGFVALGLCIGVMIGLAQVLLREAWLRVELGFRPGRELILAKPVITLGRAEACDIGLFGDNSVERVHARILLQGDRYVLADAGSASGTFVNERPVTEPVPLRSGDAIRMGHHVLRFGERQKRTQLST